MSQLTELVLNPFVLVTIFIVFVGILANMEDRKGFLGCVGTVVWVLAIMFGVAGFGFVLIKAIKFAWEF